MNEVMILGVEEEAMVMGGIFPSIPPVVPPLTPPSNEPPEMPGHLSCMWCEIASALSRNGPQVISFCRPKYI